MARYQNERMKESPHFQALRNSNLVCADCVLANDDDLSVVNCAAFPNIKPTSVLDGGRCPKHMTMEEAIEIYGDK